MKNLFLLFVIAMIHGCGCVSFAQLTPNTQTYFQNLPSPVNLIKNPDARLNALDVQKTGTVVVTATAATGNSPTYFSIGAISTLGYAEFDLRPVKSDMTSGQCEFKGKYFGTEASKYSARIFNGTTEIIKVVLQNTTSDLANGGPWGEFSVGAPCSANPKVRIYADAVGLSLNVNRLYYDKATNIGSYTPPTEFSAYFNSSGGLDRPTPVGNSPFRGNAVVSDTSLYTIPVTGLTTYANCNVTIASTENTVSITAKIESQVPGVSISVRTGQSSTSASFTKAAREFTIVCNKTGADAPHTVIRPETPRVPKLVKITTGSGTYTPTSGTKYISFKMVGGGGGGGSSGTASWGAATAGGATTFAGTFTANGGSAGSTDGQVGGLGGTANITGTGVGAAFSGGQGGPSGSTGTSGTGGNGGSSCFSGGGSGGHNNIAGGNGGSSGAGGGGASSSTSGALQGAGGGAGGCITGYVYNPTPLPYSIGAAGVGGAAGTSGFKGGDGIIGYLEITEHFSDDVAAIIAGTEQAFGRFYNVAGTNLNNSALTQIPFATADANNTGITWDSTNNCAKVSYAGNYSVKVTTILANSSYPSAEYHTQLTVNDPIAGNGINLITQYLFPGSTQAYMPMGATSDIYVNAGSCFYVHMYQASGSAKTLYNPGPTARINVLAISKIGYKQ